MNESIDDKSLQMGPVYDSIEDCIFILDGDQKIVMVNKATKSFLKKTDEEIIGKHCYELVHGTTTPPVFCPMSELFKNNKRAVSTVELAGRLYKATVDPILDENGSIIGAVHILRDVDDGERSRKRAEEIAKKHSDLIDTMFDVIFTLDLDGKVTEISPKMERIIGWSQEESIGRLFSDFVLPDDLPIAEGEFIRAIQGIGHPIEIRLAPKDNTLRWVRINALLIMNDGEPEELMCTLSDITEQKKDQALLAVQSDILTILTRFSDNQVEISKKIVSALKQATGFDAVGIRLREHDDYPFVASIGYSDEFLLAENTLTMKYPEGGLCRDKDGNVSLECTCGLLISGKADPANPLFTPGGSAWTNDSLPFLDVPLEQDPRLHPRNRCIHVGFRSLALVPLRAGDKIIGLIHFASRRTDCFTDKSIRFFESIGISIGVAFLRMFAEEALRDERIHLEELVENRTSELKTSNEELESFVYSVSHDLRAPLRSMDGFSQAVIEDYADKLDAKGQDYLNLIRDSTQRMGKLIDEMLMLSRISRAELKLYPVNLSVLADKISKELKESEPFRKVDFVIAPQIDVMGDRDLLRILMENLIGNAWKFTSKHDSARIEIGRENGIEGTSIYVKDDGAGFDMKYVDKLFIPFQRLHSVSEFPGTGVGLATIRRILNKHGGDIWAEGAVEKGAVFHFTIGSEEQIHSK